MRVLYAVDALYTEGSEWVVSLESLTAGMRISVAKMAIYFGQQVH